MRKLMILLAAVTTAFVFSSCSSIEVTKAASLNGEQLSYTGAPVAHIYASNSGLYFCCWPIMTGSLDEPGAVTFFKDNVTVKDLVQMTTAKSKSLNAASTLNIVTTHDPVVYFFAIRKVTVSANAVK